VNESADTLAGGPDPDHDGRLTLTTYGQIATLMVEDHHEDESVAIGIDKADAVRIAEALLKWAAS
jgi:hypothetical protein